jgi:hypothetical protein
MFLFGIKSGGGRDKAEVGGVNIDLVQLFLQTAVTEG